MDREDLQEMEARDLEFEIHALNDRINARFVEYLNMIKQGNVGKKQEIFEIITALGDLQLEVLKMFETRCNGLNREKRQLEKRRQCLKERKKHIVENNEKTCRLVDLEIHQIEYRLEEIEWEWE